LDDMALLREYIERDSEEAFGLLVTRHVNKVYSVALRHTGNPDQAGEITQAVFVILAKKSRQLGKRVILSGWLCQAARLTAVTFIRGEIRRARREKEAYMQTTANENESDAWMQIASLLDAALAGLNESDRHAVVLRFFDGKSMGEVGAALGANEDAARKRVGRALEKLRKFFAKRGVSLSTAVIAGAISAHSVQAAPAALATSVTAAAIAKGGAAGSSTLTLIKGALKIMAWTKAKTAVAAGAAILLAAGTATITVKEIQEHKTYSWQDLPAYGNLLDEVPPQVRIVPSKHSQFGVCERNGKIMWLGAPVKNIVAAAYGVAPARVVVPNGPASGKYDCIANLPDGNQEALQKEVRRKLGLVGRIEERETDALLLKVSDPADLQSHAYDGDSGNFDESGGFQFGCDPLSSVAAGLEMIFEKPIEDQTGMSGNYHLQFLAGEKEWSAIESRIESVRETLLDELDQDGLELAPTNMVIKMLAVEKVNQAK